MTPVAEFDKALLTSKVEDPLEYKAQAPLDFKYDAFPSENSCARFKYPKMVPGSTLVDPKELAVDPSLVEMSASVFPIAKMVAPAAPEVDPIAARVFPIATIVAP